MVFIGDMGDIAHPRVPDDFIREVFSVLESRPDIDWQILSKRIDRLASLITSVPDHIWLGATTENQAMADARIPHLLAIDAAVRFLSVEPMLAPIQLDLNGIHWVIVGGESGLGRRPFEKVWAEDLRKQCRDAGVPFFFKQGSDRHPGRDNLLDGRTIQEWPA